MNSKLKSRTLVLFILLGITTASQAMPPRTRQREGVIQSVNSASYSFEFESAEKSVPRVLTWSKRTAFYANGNEVEPSAIRAGQLVELRYGTPFFGPPYVSKVRVLSTSPQPTTHKAK